MGLNRHKPFVVTLELSDSLMPESEARARESRLRELAQQAVLSRLNRSGARLINSTRGETDSE